MGDKEFQHDNLLYCICMMNYEIVKVQRNQGKVQEIFGGASVGHEYYRCPKAYVIMSKQPFFPLFQDVIN